MSSQPWSRSKFDIRSLAHTSVSKPSNFQQLEPHLGRPGHFAGGFRLSLLAVGPLGSCHELNSSTVVRILLWTSVRTSFNINPDCKTSCPGPAAALCHFASSWLRDFGFFPHPRPPAKRGSPVIAEKFGRKAVPLQQDIVSLSDGSSTHQKTNLEIRDSIFARQPPTRKGFEETRPSTRRIAG